MRVKYQKWAGEEYFSPTQLQTYLKNPKAYYNQYILKLPRQSTKALEFGDAFHEACLQYFLQGKLDNKEITKKQVMAYFARKYNKNIQENLSGIDIQKSALEDLQMGQVMCAAFCDKAGDLKPSHIEHELEYFVDDFRILNTVDLIFHEDVGFASYATIEDLKTASKPYSRDFVATTFQLRSYAYAVEHNFKCLVDKVRFRVVTKTAKPKMITYELPLIGLSGWQDQFVSDLKTILYSIKAGTFFRKYDDDFLMYSPYVEADWGFKSSYSIVDEQEIN